MTFFRRLWAVYAVFLFLLMMLLSIPIVLFFMAVAPEKQALRHNIYYLHHLFTPVFLTLVGIRVRIQGKEHVDKNRSYVIVSNHNSALDFIVNAHAFPGVFRFLAKEELLKVPVFGWVVKKMCLVVNRSSQLSRARSVVELKQALSEGMSIFIYPEGRRNTTGQALANFYDGAFRIAIETRAPVAVQTIVNIRSVTTTTHALDLAPGTLHIVWDAPIATDLLTAEDVPVLKEKVRQIMLSRLHAACR